MGFTLVAVGCRKCCPRSFFEPSLLQATGEFEKGWWKMSRLLSRKTLGEQWFCLTPGHKGKKPVSERKLVFVFIHLPLLLPTPLHSLTPFSFETRMEGTSKREKRDTGGKCHSESCSAAAGFRAAAAHGKLMKWRRTQPCQSGSGAGQSGKAHGEAPAKRTRSTPGSAKGRDRQPCPKTLSSYSPSSS